MNEHDLLRAYEAWSLLQRDKPVRWVARAAAKVLLTGALERLAEHLAAERRAEYLQGYLEGPWGRHSGMVAEYNSSRPQDTWEELQTLRGMVRNPTHPNGWSYPERPDDYQGGPVEPW